MTRVAKECMISNPSWAKVEVIVEFRPVSSQLKVDIGLGLSCLFHGLVLIAMGFTRVRYHMKSAGALGCNMCPFPDPSFNLASSFESTNIDAFILQGAPRPLDHAVVNPSTSAVHRDLYPGLNGTRCKIHHSDFRSDLWRMMVCRLVFMFCDMAEMLIP